MFQALFEKCADWLFPIIIGIGIWYGVHYITLAPRILLVDQKALYSEFNKDGTLPKSVEICFKDNITPMTLNQARLEAALYTATFKHIDKPLKDKFASIEKAVDTNCGVSRARKKERQRMAPQEFKRDLQQGINMWMEIIKEFR